MIKVKEWMELVDYRITEGSDYCWQCFGTDAYSLSSWNGDHDGWSSNIVFDTKTQTVYTVEVCDYARSRAYRVINPDYKFAHDQEADHRDVNSKEAWDGIDFVDLETVEDFTDKTLAIRDGVDYDTRVDVPLNVPDDVLFELMKRAHEQDITLNQLIEDILWAAIRDEEFKQESFSREKLLDSQYPDGDGYWRDEDSWDEIAEDHLGDSEEDLLPKMKGKKKKKKD